MTTSNSDTLCVPLQLDAFVLNPAVCNTGKTDDNGARIIPISQPNYTFLRLDNYVIQSDVQNHADLHNSAPAELNSRMTDLGVRPSVPRRHRHGVYLHWILPRAYRAGISSADSGPEERRQRESQTRDLSTETSDGLASKSSNPQYIQPPTRWIVIRKLDMDSIVPRNAQDHFKDKEYQAWVIESDYKWDFNKIPDDFDLQVEMSPFVVGAAGSDVNIEQQAEVFIGRKTPLEQWTNNPNSDRADISLLRSGNQLFADYQLHNANVFSMLDNFQYGKSEYLECARASYYLLGWHGDENHDPLRDSSMPHTDKLRALFMSLSQNGVQSVTDWLAAYDKAHLVCHGAMYDVKWDHSKKPAHVPADDFASRLKKQEVPAVSVGTTPMDSLISYCTARKGKEDSSVDKLEEMILAIDSLLHARDDGVEGQREAKDTVYNWNFARAQGGTHYFIGGEDSKGKPTEPNARLIGALKKLNQYQLLMDACIRVRQQYRWDMFSTWWKVVSDVSVKDGPNKDTIKIQDYKGLRAKAADRLQPLTIRIDGLKKEIDSMLRQTDPNLSENAKPGTLPFYYCARDPTVLVGGIDSGWPSDFLNDVSVRLPAQIAQSEGLPDALSKCIPKITAVLPSYLKTAVEALSSEFHALRPDGHSSGDSPAGKSYPQFHDMPDGRWRDQWGDRQPWFPLYAEWEAEYTHIPFDWWTLDEQTVRLSDNKLIRYGVNKAPGDKPIYEALGSAENHDTRILSGRVLILPQPSFSLAAKVKQLFADTSPDILDQYLKSEKRQKLLEGISKLSYLSSPLSGLTNGLITLAQGSHIKPENKVMGPEGETTTAISAAIKAAEPAEFKKEDIELIAGNSALTPFATLKRFTDSLHCPFKPVTHGQFRFRKFNIIDKFGQALVAIDPQPHQKGPPPLYPSISDFYEPQLVPSTNTANTVIKDSDYQCEFIQLPPQINQNARLNAEFVIRTAEDPVVGDLPSSGSNDRAYWRPMTEWEQPIWGWIVINFADYGIQLFLHDGTFYREVRYGGPNGALANPEWMPFAPPEKVQGANVTQLDELVDRLSHQSYLKGFWHMITAALDSLPPAPNDYSQYLNSIVGKPFALVNMGWSLELDGPPLQNQATNVKVRSPDRHLLPLDSDDDHSYKFQVKLGDKEREYDGLVGYFELNEKLDKGKELNLGDIYTYFAPETPMNPLKPMKYPTFDAYWEPPFPESAPFDKAIEPALYADLRNHHLQVFGAIIDPFTPIHACSSILPARTLQLPSWTWQEAMENMTAFFHTGPLTLTGDVLAYNSDNELKTENMKSVPPHNVSIPALGEGEWNWLQPYVNPELQKPPVYNAYGIEKKGDVTKPGFQQGPYTAIEGFLQLRRPLMGKPSKQGE